MSGPENGKQSRLIPVLREGVSVIQMIFFKEVRDHLRDTHRRTDRKTISMLAGAITNELFGTPNPEPAFARFLEKQQATIEQEMLGLSGNLPHVRRYITDALRIQALCDSQEGRDQSDALIVADKLGMLLKDREIPLPSTFMTMVREIGEQYQLIIPPVRISDEEDRSILH